MLRVLQIRLPENHTSQALEKAISKRLKVKREAIKTYKVHKRSVDARKKKKIVFVYAVDVDIDNENDVLQHLKESNVFRAREEDQRRPSIVLPRAFSHRPVVVGSGPAGLFAALSLIDLGYAPIIYERGEPVEDRARSVQTFIKTGSFSSETNVAFGEGGAGTFSDGKLYTLINDVRVRSIFEQLVEAGAPDDILFQGKPHIGTDNLRRVVKNLREKIIDRGGSVFFNSKVTNIYVENGVVRGVEINNNQQVHAENVFFAIGASARDTYDMLYSHGVQFAQKPFSLGVRIEHPQSVINTAQYGTTDPHARLGAAEYKLVHHCKKTHRTVYTFCMCPGGYVVSSGSEIGGIVTNGMSEYSRDGYNANSGLVVAVEPSDFNDSHPLAGIAYQRQWEEAAYRLGGSTYAAPVQRVEDFLKDRKTARIGIVEPTYKPGVVCADIRACLPSFVTEALKEGIREFDKKVRGFAHDDAVITGVETRTSAPVKITRNRNYESTIRGVYPIGEGSGYAGGIVSAAVDGVKAVEALSNVNAQ